MKYLKKFERKEDFKLLSKVEEMYNEILTLLEQKIKSKDFIKYNEDKTYFLLTEYTIPMAVSFDKSNKKK